ncbi:MAG: class I SAM-dependent methyltransferase [Candidatus Bathyarchaeota archaeon]|nr:class I SAM-dependent methyltransferase [Candidatus Bathyarchaeota archaeon]
MTKKRAHFWEERYRSEGKVWGDAPSVSVDAAINYFVQNCVHKVLVPGSGYGRNAEALAKAGFEVSGVEVSEIAYCAAVSSNEEKGLGIDYKLGDILEMPCGVERFEGVYCFNLLHLFRQEERLKFIDYLCRVLKPGGIIVLTAFSEKEESFGIGEEIEPDTFESKKGRPVHYFTEKDLNEHFRDFDILENTIIEEPENHGDGPHIHLLRLIVAKK